MSKKGRWIPQDEKYADDRVMITCTGYIADTKTDDVFLSVQALINKYNEILKENEQLKQRINSRLHFYRELYESTNDDVVKRVIEDLEDILR